MLRLLPLILLAACTTHTTILPPEPPPAAECPEPAAPIVVKAPPPVWPDSCVADWYAKATLPPCVEKYLGDLKVQQKSIAKKRRAR